MNCRIIAIDNFRREAKRLLKNSLAKSRTAPFGANPARQSTYRIEITSNTYKIRLAVKSKGKGKSGGMRIITHVVEIELQIEAQETETTVFLLSIYDKSEEGNISDKELRGLIEDAIQDLDDV